MFVQFIELLFASGRVWINENIQQNINLFCCSRCITKLSETQTQMPLASSTVMSTSIFHQVNALGTEAENKFLSLSNISEMHGVNTRILLP